MSIYYKGKREYKNQFLNDKQLQLITITSVIKVGLWNFVNGLYEQNIEYEKIGPDSIVNVIPSNSDYTVVANAGFLPRTDSGVGYVKVYAQNLASTDINVTLNIWK
jgi:hypothetical protein